MTAVLDTCALLWWTLDPGQLSAPALAACEEIERKGGYASAISVWEIGIKVKRGKLDLGLPFHDYVRRLRAVDVLTLLPVDTDIWVANLALNWDHRDPADRTIVATAMQRELPIVTKDRLIANYYAHSIW